MKQIELNVEAREIGKHNSRELRTNRRVPAVVYGTIKDNANIHVYEGDIVRYKTRAFENALFSLKSKDSALNGKVVLMKSVSVHPVSRRPEHVDFFALDLKKAVRINVEIKVEGKAAGLSEGGLLNVVLRQLEIECLPTEIPEAIIADVTELGVGDALHVSDLKVPAGVKVITGMEQTVAVVNVIEEEVVEAPTAAVADAATPAAGAAAPAAGAAAPAAGAAAPKKDEKK